MPSGLATAFGWYLSFHRSHPTLTCLPVCLLLRLRSPRHLLEPHTSSAFSDADAITTRDEKVRKEVRETFRTQIFLIFTLFTRKTE